MGIFKGSKPSFLSFLTIFSSREKSREKHGESLVFFEVWKPQQRVVWPSINWVFKQEASKRLLSLASYTHRGKVKSLRFRSNYEKLGRSSYKQVMVVETPIEFKSKKK
ncbi:hypothetical protein Csa_008547 [Cucumis sativus]|uniref:Uncharacterized protein n=1 Tax=Cucumis sativus TaxID=3659 RepID=A0A0A0KP84_CUCSA|nr:hypothetical protein Csa_008547 [Cucumis sativus]